MDLTKYVLDAAGNPQPEHDLLAWAQWMGTGDNSVIKREQVGRVRVSTVFLGLDHGWGTGQPLMLGDDGLRRQIGWNVRAVYLACGRHRGT